MHTTNLRQVGGSVMMAVPRAILDLLNLGVGARVALDVEAGQLVVRPQPTRPTLAELLAQCDLDAPISDPMSDEDRAWLDGPAVGNELI